MIGSESCWQSKLRIHSAQQECLIHHCAHTHRQPRTLQVGCDTGNRSIDTKSGMLSSISQKHKTRSKLCWFTEFCNSQRLSHFAAPFIVVQAETSIAENCISHTAATQHTKFTDYLLLTQNGSMAGTARHAAPPILLPANFHMKHCMKRPIQKFKS